MVNEHDFSSVAMTHLPDEVFAAPMVTNGWAEAQACRDPVALSFFLGSPDCYRRRKPR